MPAKENRGKWEWPRSKWKIPLRTVFRPYCFPLSWLTRRKITETTRTSAVDRHVTPLHVPSSCASGHFRDHRAARTIHRFERYRVRWGEFSLSFKYTCPPRDRRITKLHQSLYSVNAIINRLKEPVFLHFFPYLRTYPSSFSIVDKRPREIRISIPRRGSGGNRFPWLILGRRHPFHPGRELFEEETTDALVSPP